MNNIRTASGRELRSAGLIETPLPFAYDPTALPGARVLGDDGQIYESMKDWVTGVYEWKVRAQGEPGPALELQKSVSHIQWRVEGSTAAWTDLVPLTELTGPQGPEGPIGPQGAGLSYQGTVATVGDLPTPSTTAYAYLVTSTGDLWIYSGTTWNNAGPIQGPEGPIGPTGDQGPAGIDGIDGVDGASVQLQKTSTEIQWRLVGGSTWNTLVTLDELKGPVGDDGPPGPSGPGFSYRGTVATVGNLPSSSTQGYALEVEATGDLYIFDGLVWVNSGPFRGPKGDTGDQGLTGPVGPGFSFQGSVATTGDLPSPSVQGHAYRVNADNNLYIYNGTIFVNAGPIQGPQGEKGDQGDTGPEGPQGEIGESFNFRGSVSTPASLPVPSTPGHAYTVNSTGDLYIFNDTGWVNAGPLRGPQGEQGIQGIQGVAGDGFRYQGTVANVASLPTPSSIGFAYKVESNGNLYIYNGTEWLNAGPLQGPQGVQGIQGLTGPVGPGFNYQGELATIGSLPSPSTQGFAYRIGTDLYIYNGTSWVNAGPLQGPKGDKGDQGDTGATGAGFRYQGSVATIGSLPSPSTTGFGYKVEATGDLYIYNGSSWVNAGPLQGPQGPQGIQGIQGLQGIKGDTGDSGVTTATLPLTYNPTTKEVGINAATAAAAGSMSAGDKARLDAATGDLVGTTATQTLTNKTLGTIREAVFAITDGASVDLNPSNGAIQTWTLGASRTATANNFPEGASMLLCVDDGSAFTLTWPTITWVGSTTAPTLATTGYTFIQMWKIGTTLYGMAQK